MSTEGYIDAKSAAATVASVAQTVCAATSNTVDDAIADVTESVSEGLNTAETIS